MTGLRLGLYYFYFNLGAQIGIYTVDSVSVFYYLYLSCPPCRLDDVLPLSALPPRPAAHARRTPPQPQPQPQP